ncbi:MAG: PQ-loop repeat-containing protein [Candidatus Gracilibacteria bacterium]
MATNWLPILGTVGNVILIAAYFPQIIKLLRTKKAEDVSVFSWLLWLIGDSCFLAYSLIEKDIYSTVLFVFYVLLGAIMLFLTHYYTKKG